ncbi:glycoside hydrolase family 5 protein [Planosporangium thailandense]|uniref:Glycoside hydrolase family 5 protein n=2 Tax=Planosporangium thailandense TaxID=765197 RepID=A0ABX0Y7E6_9ACTN|nr:cellulase family glycosylhydrolase [Planosporangium thailandense]NJC73465.1 glycoside hydrolase family 5 protein [Planosporangium thailandense]
MAALATVSCLVSLAALTTPALARGHGRAADPVGAGLGDSWSGPLSTVGRYIVDARGNRFKLKAGNWHGASGTWTGSGDPNDPANNHAGEKSDEMPLGLDRAPIAEIIASFHELGLNSIRLPFSNEMIHDTRAVPDASVAANPQLRGRTPLQVYDEVVRALTADGFAVILNNHTNTSKWCCGIDGNERWNASQSDARWENDWLFMARRYAGNKRVVGADLYNEVRRSILDDPNWGLGDSHDWQAASQRAGDRILAEANPDLLIIVEGINWTGLPIDGFPHGRPTLEPVAQLSHTLVRSHKLVYSAHFYGYTGPNHSGATGIGETHDPRYQDLSRDQLFDVVRRQALYVAETDAQHFTAPVWISEFGVGGRDNTDQKSRDWFHNFVDLLIANDTDFAYWPLVGWHEGRHGNGWALMAWDAAGHRMGLHDGDDWRAADWQRLIDAPGRTGHLDPVRTWSMLTLDHGDFDQSSHMRGEPDWDPGARKAVCPDGERLAGLSHTAYRGLCTDAAVAADYTVVRDESFVDADWAYGFTKLQCPRGQAVTGYSARGADLSSVLCTQLSAAAGTATRTVWFDRGDDRPDGTPGGDFAIGDYKGQCAGDEYVAGVAYRRVIWSPDGEPDALLCRKLA